MSAARRVVVTGVGCVTPIGTGAAGLWEGLRARRSAVRSITRFDPTPFRSRIAAELPDFRPQDFLDGRRARRLDRFSQLAVVSARQAIEHAHLALAAEDRDRVGTMMGSALGGVAYAEEQAGMYAVRGLRGLDAGLALSVFGGASSCNIAIELGVTGPNSTNAMSCASGTIAVGDAFHAIRGGGADVMLAGGAEAPLVFGVLRAWDAMRSLATEDPQDPSASCRPFARTRTGLVLGEGAAFAVLEEWDRAVARDAPIYGELSGYGLTSDVTHVTRPTVAGQANAMRAALDSAGLHPDSVDYINAHGTGTLQNDAVETAAIKAVFGPRAYSIPVSSTKSMHGHLLGAAGALEFVIAVLCLKRAAVPPTMHLNSPDPACDLDYVAGEARHGVSIRTVMSNSFAFGGTNAVLIATVDGVR